MFAWESLGTFTSASVKFVSVSDVNGDKTDFGDSLGLMGSFGTGRMVASAGKVIEGPNAFGLEWQVRESQPMLFRANRAPQFIRSASYSLQRDWPSATPVGG